MRAAGWAGAVRGSGIAAGAVAVAVLRSPVMDGHQAVLEVPFDEQRRRDAQHEHERLLRRVLGPPRAGGGAAEFWAGLDDGSVQLEFTLAAVGAGHDAVQYIARIAAQVGGFRGPGNGADQ